MVFSSSIFIFVFLPCVILINFILRPSYRNIFLFLASIVFYAWGEPQFIFIMLASISINYIFGLLVNKFRDYTNISRVVLALMVMFNGSLFFNYKYYDFTINNFNKIFSTNIPIKNIALPIGISFFTFQAMSYVFDVYNQKGKVQKNPLNVALYIMLFPQLVAGPIVRYETIANQISERDVNLSKFSIGVERFIIGLGKKIILANSMALIADKVYSNGDITQLSVSALWIGSIAYTFQIYFDFSGYSDMAIGLGKIFGFDFEENFNYPYMAMNITDFWRRWHISLSTWFRDYVYIPLGGSKGSVSKNIFNLFIVWLLTGIWHGANWTFIIWGLYYFTLLCIEKFMGLNKIKSKGFSIAYRFLTLFFVNIGWVLFRSPNLQFASDYIKTMLFMNNTNIIDDLAKFLFYENKVILFLCILLCTNFLKKIDDKYKEYISYWTVKNTIMISIFIIVLSYTLNIEYNPFIYFNF